MAITLKGITLTVGEGNTGDFITLTTSHRPPYKAVPEEGLGSYLWLDIVRELRDDSRVTASGVKLRASDPVSALAELRAIFNGHPGDFRADGVDWYVFASGRKKAYVVDLNPLNHQEANLQHDSITNPRTLAAREVQKRLLSAEEVTEVRPGEQEGIVVCLTHEASKPPNLLSTYLNLLALI